MRGFVSIFTTAWIWYFGSREYIRGYGSVCALDLYIVVASQCGSRMDSICASSIICHPLVSSLSQVKQLYADLCV